MIREFHTRFRIEVPLEAAKKRFVNRALNRVFDSYMWRLQDPHSIKRAIVTALGDYCYDHKDLQQYIADDFHRCLLALEALYYAVPDGRSAGQVDGLIEELLSSSEVDLDVRWRDGGFYPAGAEELDRGLVDFNLDWLRLQGLDTVAQPYRKGLHHFLEAQSRSELMADVITDMYEAFEAIMKAVTGRPRVDRETREEFFRKIGANGLCSLAKEYGDYAHSFRHAADPDRGRNPPAEADVEAFVYLTGLFLRFASSIYKKDA